MCALSACLFFARRRCRNIKRSWKLAEDASGELELEIVRCALPAYQTPGASCSSHMLPSSQMLSSLHRLERPLLTSARHATRSSCLFPPSTPFSTHVWRTALACDHTQDISQGFSSQAAKIKLNAEQEAAFFGQRGRSHRGDSMRRQKSRIGRLQRKRQQADNDQATGSESESEEEEEKSEEEEEKQYLALRRAAACGSGRLPLGESGSGVGEMGGAGNAERFKLGTSGRLGGDTPLRSRSHRGGAGSRDGLGRLPREAGGIGPASLEDDTDGTALRGEYGDASKLGGVESMTGGIDRSRSHRQLLSGDGAGQKGRPGRAGMPRGGGGARVDDDEMEYSDDEYADASKMQYNGEGRSRSHRQRLSGDRAGQKDRPGRAGMQRGVRFSAEADGSGGSAVDYADASKLQRGMEDRSRSHRQLLSGDRAGQKDRPGRASMPRGVCSAPIDISDDYLGEYADASKLKYGANDRSRSHRQRLAGDRAGQKDRPGRMSMPRGGGGAEDEMERGTKIMPYGQTTALEYSDEEPSDEERQNAGRALPSRVAPHSRHRRLVTPSAAEHFKFGRDLNARGRSHKDVYSRDDHGKDRPGRMGRAQRAGGAQLDNPSNLFQQAIEHAVDGTTGGAVHHVVDNAIDRGGGSSSEEEEEEGVLASIKLGSSVPSGPEPAASSPWQRVRESTRQLSLSQSQLDNASDTHLTALSKLGIITPSKAHEIAERNSFRRSGAGQEVPGAPTSNAMGVSDGRVLGAATAAARKPPPRGVVGHLAAGIAIVISPVTRLLGLFIPGLRRRKKPQKVPIERTWDLQENADGDIEIEVDAMRDGKVQAVKIILDRDQEQALFGLDATASQKSHKDLHARALDVRSKTYRAAQKDRPGRMRRAAPSAAAAAEERGVKIGARADGYGDAELEEGEDDDLEMKNAGRARPMRVPPKKRAGGHIVSFAPSEEEEEEDTEDTEEEDSAAASPFPHFKIPQERTRRDLFTEQRQRSHKHHGDDERGSSQRKDRPGRQRFTQEQRGTSADPRPERGRWATAVMPLRWRSGHAKLAFNRGGTFKHFGVIHSPMPGLEEGAWAGNKGADSAPRVPRDGRRLAESTAASRVPKTTRFTLKGKRNDSFRADFLSDKEPAVDKDGPGRLRRRLARRATGSKRNLFQQVVHHPDGTTGGPVHHVQRSREIASTFGLGEKSEYVPRLVNACMRFSAIAELDEASWEASWGAAPSAAARRSAGAQLHEKTNARLSKKGLRWQKIRQEAAMAKHTLTAGQLEGLSVVELRAVQSLGIISEWTMRHLVARKRTMGSSGAKGCSSAPGALRMAPRLSVAGGEAGGESPRTATTPGGRASAAASVFSTPGTRQSASLESRLPQPTSTLRASAGGAAQSPRHSQGAGEAGAIHGTTPLDVRVRVSL